MSHQGPEEITSRAVSDIEKKGESVGEKIKAEKFDANRAARETKGEIFLIAKNAKDKIAPTEFSKKKADNIRFMDRVEAAKKTADKKIDDNMEFYGNLAAYIKKRTEISLILESNAHAIKQAEASYDFSNAYLFKQTMEGLEGWLSELKKQPDVGMNGDRAELQKRIEDQKKQLQASIEGMIDYHRKKMQKHDQDMKDLEERFNPATAHLYPSVIDEKQVRLLYFHLYYLEQLRVSATDSLEMSGMSKDVEDRRTKLEALLAKAEKMTANSEAMKNHKSLWKFYQKQRENLKRAEENMARVQAKKNVSQAEIDTAQQWLTGARQTCLKPLAEFRQAYVDMRMDEGNQLAFEHDREIAESGERGNIYASTTIASFQEEWDMYDKLKADLTKAQENLAAKKKKTSDKTELGRAYWQLSEARRKFNEHVGKLKGAYADMGTDPQVYADLTAEGIIEGKVRMGTTVVEGEEAPEKPVAPPPTMVASKGKGTKKEKQA